MIIFSYSKSAYQRIFFTIRFIGYPWIPMSASYYINLYCKDFCKQCDVFPLLVVQNPKDNIMVERKVPNMQEDYIIWESKHLDYHNYVIPEDGHRTYSRQNILVFLNCGCRRPDLWVNDIDDSTLIYAGHISHLLVFYRQIFSLPKNPFTI